MRKLIAGPVGAIEIQSVQQSKSTSLALICHPHPLYGGTMDNKVITTVARYFQSANSDTVTFNFRGVGKSEGVHDHARGEIEDAWAVLQYSLTQYPKQNHLKKIHIAGFSFGAYIAAALAHRVLNSSSSDFIQQTPIDLTLIAPVVDRYAMDHLRLPEQTRAIIGLNDELIASEKVVEWGIRHSYSTFIVPDASHFFHGKLAILQNTLSYSEFS